jgi:hypothetical protein
MPNTPLNFTLPIGAASESITVEGGTQAINTEDGAVSTAASRPSIKSSARRIELPAALTHCGERL